jgi:hypothetical protein
MYNQLHNLYFLSVVRGMIKMNEIFGTRSILDTINVAIENVIWNNIQFDLKNV